MKRQLLSLILTLATALFFIACETETILAPGTTLETAITFLSAEETGGTSGTADTTGLTLTFDVDPTTLLTADNIAVIGATKGALTGSGTTRSLAISELTVDNGETVSVVITSPGGFAISDFIKTEVIYRKIYDLRDTGPAGGLIFYDKGSYSYGWRYFESAPETTEWTSKEWGKNGTVVAGTGTAIGTGKNNTALIVAALNAAPADFDRAAQLCDALSHNGFADWFLPSKDELNQMWVNLRLENVGGFVATDSYWSSSEVVDNYYAWMQLFFFTGSQSGAMKISSVRVRAIRVF